MKEPFRYHTDGINLFLFSAYSEYLFFG